MKYLIRRGDTLSQIAQAHGVSVETIMRANPSIKDRNKIYAGRTLDIPMLDSWLHRLWSRFTGQKLKGD